MNCVNRPLPVLHTNIPMCLSYRATEHLRRSGTDAGSQAPSSGCARGAGHLPASEPVSSTAAPREARHSQKRLPDAVARIGAGMASEAGPRPAARSDGWFRNQCGNKEGLGPASWGPDGRMQTRRCAGGGLCYGAFASSSWCIQARRGVDFFGWDTLAGSDRATARPGGRARR